MKEKERLQKKIEIYEKALKRIANIDEDQSVKRRTESDDTHKSAFALGVAQKIAEIALENGGERCAESEHRAVDTKG